MNRPRTALALLVALAAAIIIGVGGSAAVGSLSDNSKDKAPAASTTTTKPGGTSTTANPSTSTPSGSSTTTSIMAGPSAGYGTPDDPYVGNAGNTNPVLSEVASYQSLVKALVAQPGRGVWYTDDLQRFNGISRDDILRAAELEKQGNDLRFILISNSGISDAEARAQLKAEGVKEIDRLPIVRVNGFINTRGLPDARMDPFEDNRSQVRVSLGIPNDWNDLSKGLQADRGILTMCGNGWKKPPARTPTTTAPPVVTTTTAPPVTTTTRPVVTTTTSPITTTTQLVCPPGTIKKDGRCEKPPDSED